MKKVETKTTGLSINQEEIQTYLKDLRKIDVMTPQREKELAQKILSGTCSPKEVKQIEEELIQGNLRFVITVAKQYQSLRFASCKQDNRASWLRCWNY